MSVYDDIDTFIRTDPPGWCTAAKALKLAEYVIAERLTHVVEIGVFGGRSLIPMAMAVKSLGAGGFVMGVDPYTPEKNVEGMEDEGHVQWAKTAPYETVYRVALQAVRECGLQDYCAVVRAPAECVACLVGPLDLLHLDGCHSTIASCRDVETWLPKVSPGGLFVVDDTHWPTVAEAVATIAAGCDSIHAEDGWEVFRKR